ncbi:MAG TPA: carboxypeptidase regulatory-like domain-containing protein [Terriglobales bacterium]|nr:carboxypeptidase regulatory-like domain-containing protein [Terriglobales bacterium]
MNWNFQLGLHPDADQLSVFVEGAATSREHEQMLAHLAECGECRKAVFFMQPHEEMQPATRTPVKGWIWGRLLPVGLPAAALACGVAAVLVHIWNRDSVVRNPQQIASLRKTEVHLPPTTVAPSTDSEKDRRSEAARVAAPASNHSGQANLSLPKSFNMPQSSGQPAAKIAAPETTVADPSAGALFGHAGGSAGGVIGGLSPQVPLTGRSVLDLQQLSTAQHAQGAASQNSLADKKDLPALEIERASGQGNTLAELSGRITDRTGAIISGASVSLRDAAGKTRETTTGVDGSFHLTELPAGQYELTATASGFRTNKQSIQLNPSQLAMLQPVLDIGTASEAVTVQAASAAVEVQTESANAGEVISGKVITEMHSMRAIVVPSGLPVVASVSHGKRFLSLDSTGNLFLSRNGGKKWKKINPQWTGKAVRIEITPAYRSDAPPKPKNETLGKADEAAVFLLTTDSGTVWASKDGAHWRQQ